MTAIIDTAVDVSAKLAKLRALGIETVIRYLNRRKPSGEKVVKPSEARAFKKAGMKLALVYEYNADVATLTDANGYLDAKWSLGYVPTIGMPHSVLVQGKGPAIYFAVDLDPTKRQVERNVLPYFAGIKRALGASPWFRVGVYGSGDVCTALQKEGLVDLTWITQSMGFSGTRAYLAAGKETMVQKLPKLIAGIDTDPDERGPHADDIGDFLPVL